MVGVDLQYSTVCHTFIHLSTTVKYVHKNCHGTFDSIFYNYLRERPEQNPKCSYSGKMVVLIPIANMELLQGAVHPTSKDRGAFSSSLDK